MNKEKHKSALKEEIMEIEALIEKWQPALDAETRWALNLLKLSLYRRKQLLLQLAIAETDN